MEQFVVLASALLFNFISEVGRAAVAGAAEATAAWDGHVVLTSVVAAVGGVIALVVIVVICMSTAKQVNPSARTAGPPDWTHSLVFRQEYAGGFTDLSDGMISLGPCHVMRKRLGKTVTDAARWCSGFTEGKHVFEVLWPSRRNRGITSCIGLGSAEVPLRKQGRVTLVGEHSQSWGLDLTKRRTYHFNQVQQRLSLGIPDKFFMYVDMDGGKIGFGADVAIKGYAAEFYGFILHGIPKNAQRPMYVMVNSCTPNEVVQLYYRGTHTPFGGYDLCHTVSPIAAPPPIEAPPQYKAPQPDAALFTISGKREMRTPQPLPSYHSEQAKSSTKPSSSSSRDDEDKEQLKF